jgi:poly-gamma-glutamate synthesis protein (capsule biosynthesis protein)
MFYIIWSATVLQLLSHVALHEIGDPVAGRDAKCAIPAFPTLQIFSKPASTMNNNTVRLFLSGDVMTGRAIDQILPHPGDPQLHERYVTRATTYLELAEKTNGPIPRDAGFGYIWGAGLAALSEMAPNARIINLETAITDSDNHWKGKAVNYRMNPPNTPVLTAAKIDFCALANNHTMDYGLAGLKETIESLEKEKIKFAGAGANTAEASRPAIIDVPGKARIVVFSVGSTNSGIPEIWAATNDRPGLNVIRDYNLAQARSVMSWSRRNKKQNDILIVSIHWGGNWGYDIPGDQYASAHTMVDDWGVDIVLGHSSHHPKGIELYKGKLIIYGAGDLINDYEGISGYEEYRAELCLMYFPVIEIQSGDTHHVQMVPFRMMNFQLVKASAEEATWLAETMGRQSEPMGTQITLEGNYTLCASRIAGGSDAQEGGGDVDTLQLR